ncbi:MAG: alpha/beta hydrolase [Propionibacteriaceae bacterium]|jgi:acetyl esterase/lipase|nr:alpha/beta hydrolase [Propionibacteriaceae bacterium]
MDIGLVDPALQALVLKQKRLDITNPAIRAAARLAGRLMPIPAARDQVGVRVIRAAGGVAGRLYRPFAPAPTAGGLLWIHGGGYLFGGARQDQAICSHLCSQLRVVVFSADYRLAPRHPFPAALEDVRLAWRWLAENAASLGVDPNRLALGGESAGGGLAAALAQLLADQAAGSRAASQPAPVAQWLFAPMLDDRTAADRSLDSTEHWIWQNRDNRFAWQSYLGQPPGPAHLPPYAAPGRRAVLAGLPPAYLQVGDIELFAPEVEAYAEGLRRSGVTVRLDVTPGAPHGLIHAPQTAPARRVIGDAIAWLSAYL